MRSRDRERSSDWRIREGFLEEGVCVFDLREQLGVGHVQLWKAAQVL